MHEKSGAAYIWSTLLTSSTSNAHFALPTDLWLLK
uniref:Uncharacterized protein n=1 Tax=Arundo donax TaxID=35708 RepID=A0A0A8Z6P2_ARUDO